MTTWPTTSRAADRRAVTGWEGRFLEDFRVGDVYRHAHGRTITQTDNTWFTLLTNNTHDVHSNADYASRTEFGRPLVVLDADARHRHRAVRRRTSSQNAVANLGWEDVRLPAPVFAGDTIYAESEVLEVRPSKSDRARASSGCAPAGFNQDDVTVLEFERSVLVYTRAGRPGA